MVKKLEVELKFIVLNETQVIKYLAQKKFVFEKGIVDVYLDTKQADLFKRGIFIRVRNQQKLDFKFNAAHFEHHGRNNVHDHCDEYSFTLPLTKNMVPKINQVCRLLDLQEIKMPEIKDLKEKNQLMDSMVIDKKRQVYRDELFEYSFDQVKGLGTYLEIENLDPKVESVEKMTRLMLARLESLKLKHVNVGYNELFWRKHDPVIYRQGLYLLAEDYESPVSAG